MKKASNEKCRKKTHSLAAILTANFKEKSIFVS
jgi:hypothetical protein